MRIGLVAGSVDRPSANAAVLDAAAHRLTEVGHTAVWLSGLEAVPFFRASEVDEPPTAVADLRRQVEGFDAVLIAAPEYAGGLAGGTKNALDWLVGDATLYRKVIGVASAGTTGGGFAIEQLVRTISWQGGYVVTTLPVAAPRTKMDDDGVIVDDATLREIADWVDAVVAAVVGSSTDRLDMITATVVPLGIDLARFGTIE